MPLLTPQEWVVLSFATRHILGWRDRIEAHQAPISLSRFEACGLHRSTILKALAGLAQFGLLRKVGKADERGQIWEISYDVRVDLDGLKARQAASAESVRKHTQAARSKAQTSLSDRPPGSLRHRPPPGLQLRPTGGLSLRPNKDQYKTQDQTQDSSATSFAEGVFDIFKSVLPGTQPDPPADQPSENVEKREHSETVKGSMAPSTPGSVPPPPSPRPAPAKPLQPHVAVIDAYLNALPAKPIQQGNPYKRYGAVASALVQAGITPAQITAYVRSQSQEPIWLGKCIALEYVARNINAWLQLKGMNSHEPSSTVDPNLVRGNPTASRTSPPKPRPILFNIGDKPKP